MRRLVAGGLSLFAAGAIGGGFALALSSGPDTAQQPGELHQVVATETTTASTTTTEPATATTTAAPDRTTATTAAPRPAATTSSSAPARSTPHVVTTSSSTPEASAPTHPPVIPGNGPTFCGGTTTCTAATR